MKKLLSLATLIIISIALTTVGCKKKKDQDYSFLGVWNMNSQTEKTYINGTLDEQNTYTFDPGEMVIKLFDDGTGEEWEDGILNDEFDWEVDGNTISVDIDGDFMDLTWSVSGNTLTMTMEEEEEYEGDTYRYVRTMVATKVTK
jgi:hypothetical protein